MSEATTTTNKNNNEEAAAATHPHRKHSVWGILLIMMGAFSFSVMFLLVKIMADTNTFTLVFYRSLVQIAISLASLWQQGENPLGPPDFQVRFYLVIRAVFGASAVCAWFFGIQILPLPDAVTLQFTTPAFAAMIAVCMVGEKWMPLDMIGAVVCLTGVAFIAHPTWLFGSDGSSSTVDDVGQQTALLLKALAVMVTAAGAVMAGIAYVSVRKIGNRASAIVMVLYYGALSIPMTIIGSGLLLGEWRVWRGVDFNLKNTALILLMGFGGYGGQWFTNLGLQIETAATATLATCTQIVWTYIFELTLLHETLDKWSLGGTGLILGYMLIVAVLKMTESEKEEKELSSSSSSDGTSEERTALLEVANGSSDPKLPSYQAIDSSR